VSTADRGSRVTFLRRVALAVVLATVAALLVAALAPSRTPTLRVYGAASLRDAFPALDAAPTYDFGGSDQLQMQIERGAPADVFASASPKQADALFRAGRCTRPVVFATNRLVIIVPKDNPGHVRSVADLGTGGRRVAVGAEAVPVGGYTRALLEQMHLSSVLRANTVSQEASVAGITAKVALGSADAGFVYVTDARGARGRVGVVELPRSAQPPVHYEICVVRRPGANAEAAQRFIDKVRSSAGRATLRRFGFGLPPRG